jgi:O-antigen/teichoic acid export membrane protein
LLRSTLLHGASAATSLLLFLLLVAAGRLLGAEEFGYFSFALAFVFFFDFLLDPRLLAQALGWKLLLAPMVVTASGLMAVWIQPSRRAALAVTIMAGAQVVRSLKEGIRATLLGRERFGLDALSLTAERTGLLVAGLLVLVRGGGLIPLCLVFLGVRVVDLVLLIGLVRFASLRLSIGLGGRQLHAMLRAALPIGIYYVTLNVYNYVDTVMLAALRPGREVGWYGAAYRIYEGLFLFPAILGTVFMPRLSRAHQADPGTFQVLCQRGTRLALLLGMALGLNVALLSAPLIALTFGADYDPSILTLKVLMSGLPVVFVLHFLQPVALAMDRQRLLLISGIAGLTLNVLLNGLLIPRHGQLGAALVTVVVEALVLVGLGQGLTRGFGKGGWRTSFWAPLLLVGVPVVAVCWLLWRAPLPLLWVFGNAVLIAAAALTGAIHRDEWRALLTSLRPRKVGEERPR